MNISIYSCNIRPVIKRLTITILLFYSATLQSWASSQSPTGFQHSSISTTLSFHKVQCPPVLHPPERKENFCHRRPQKFIDRVYDTHKSVFNDQQLRPLTFHQQLAMLELFFIHGITTHNYDLLSMVFLTQNTNLSKLSPVQQIQARDWREFEGSIVREKACANNNHCKEETTTYLNKMRLYNSLVPKFQHYDYTILLGGSIQEMQWRMLMLLSLFNASLHDKTIDLGNIVALTCDRVVTKDEVDDSARITMFNISLDPRNELAKASISNDGEEVILTETTSFQAIYFGLKRMSESRECFNHFRETSAGYHPHLPVSFLAEGSFEASLYRKKGFTYQLSADLPEILTAFFNRYPEAVYFESNMIKKGENLKKRPTTKLTAREWLLSVNNAPPCKDPNHCKILLISNAPSAYYQHTAVIQAFEESLTSSNGRTYEIYTAAPAASPEIPTNSVLDNLTKLLYLEAFHPEE